MKVQPERDEELRELLGSISTVQPAGLSAWFAVRFGRGEYGIFSFSEEGQERPVRMELPELPPLVGDTPSQSLEVLASKLPDVGPPSDRAVFLTFQAKAGNEPAVEQFLRDARAIAMREAKTTAWFALALGGGVYGIFDVFPDRGGQVAHLTGKVPRELAKHSLTLLGGVPQMKLPRVIAEALPGSSPRAPAPV